MRSKRASLKSWILLGVGVLAILAWGLAGPASAGEKIVLNVVTAGDTNMHELQKNIFGPAFSRSSRTWRSTRSAAARATREVR